MVVDKQGACAEYDAIHQSRVRGGHSCSCGHRQGHGKVHVCPTCERHWGHPEMKLKATPHAGPKVRRFRPVASSMQPLR